jgi:hypothetical protein
MAEKKYIVKALNAGPHMQGTIITKSDCGPDGAWFDKWVGEGAIEEYKGDAATTAEAQAEASAPENTTGDIEVEAFDPERVAAADNAKESDSKSKK